MQKVSMQGPGPAGSTLQWSGTVHEDGLLIVHGKATSSRPRKTRIPLSQCENGDPSQELEKRYEEKLSEGFWSLGQPEESHEARSARAYLKAAGGQVQTWF